jgi:OPA family glycerol-3-phosphate transporter-like MFS transporter
MSGAAIDPVALKSAPEVVHPDGFRKRRAQNWVFLGLMYGFFYMSRYNLAAIQQALKEQFGWSNTQYGSIVSAGTLVYGCAVFLNGPLADKIRGKRAILIGSAGAAIFNFLFGLCFIFLGKAALWKDGKMVAGPVFAHGMTATTLIATFSVLWGCNHYFQSFGALSIVKINAAWFHLRERGSFAGIFGIMIQSGRLFAFAFSPFILRFLPWQFCFWIPAAILAGMFFVNRRYVENAPSDAGFVFGTGDESPAEEGERPTLGFVLKKVFASRAAWLIALSSICIGMVRNSIDHWWTGYIDTVFHVRAADNGKFLPYVVVSYLTPLFAVLGGLAAGNASDRLFGARRAPVIFFAFIGMGLSLVGLHQGLHSPWVGALLLLIIAFFIQSAHSLVGGAASMDFGGRKAVATAAGLFDGAQYLASTLVGYGMGRLLDAYKDAKLPGAEYDVWPLAPLPFTILGAILIARLWHVVPGRPAEIECRERATERRRTLARVHLVQRVALGLWATIAGAYSVLAIILPQKLARETMGRALPAAGVVFHQRFGGAQLGLALVALVAASTARPPKVLVRAVLLALIASLVGPLFSAITQTIAFTDLAPLKGGMLLDGLLVVVLLGTSVVRANLAVGSADPPR